jgi:hypothetical protein
VTTIERTRSWPFDQELALQQSPRRVERRRSAKLFDQVERDRAADDGELLQQGTHRKRQAFITCKHQVA